MEPDFVSPFVTGVERLAAWADLLDRINVFPVADGDTGRNLLLSLAPLRTMGRSRPDTITRLLMSARGNSGNIACRFLSGFLPVDSFEALPECARNGRDLAWQAVEDPMPGTILTVLDALVEFVEANQPTDPKRYVADAIDVLEAAVRSTPDLLPKLKKAGVVDSGALGMFIFLEGFFNHLVGREVDCRPITTVFRDLIEVSPVFEETVQEGYCVDTVIHLSGESDKTLDRLAGVAESVVAISHQDYLKIHLHTDDAEKARAVMMTMGDVLHWSHDDLDAQIRDFNLDQRIGSLHIMTDAAGSVTRKNARELGLTLLDSYINVGDKSLPETFLSPEELYRAMRRGVKVSTSQASVFERHQHYQRVVSQFERVLYLCVGSVFTGNYDIVQKWRKTNDPANRMTVVDTAAASGRLGLVVLLTVEFAADNHDPEAVIQFAQKAVRDCEEYVFLDRLKYLAAGGRLSRPSAFLGDMFQVKPIITPIAQGAVKVGSAKNAQEQIDFAAGKLAKHFSNAARPVIMLEYSDNKDWIRHEVLPSLKGICSHADFRVQPLSLTSGVHMGPGTWGIAFLPE